MEIINRVKIILLSPKKEWEVIKGEDDPHGKVFISYVLPLALIPAVCSFIGYGLIGYSVLGVHIGSISWGIRQAITQFVATAAGVYITAWVIQLLAENFGSEKNFDKAFSLVAYAYTPMCVGGVLYLLPALSTLASIASLYGLYLLYIGLQPMMKTPAEKNTSYFVITLLVTVLVTVILSVVLAAILLRGIYF
jgi:hypothetical protein